MFPPDMISDLEISVVEDRKLPASFNAKVKTLRTLVMYTLLLKGGRMSWIRQRCCRSAGFALATALVEGPPPDNTARRNLAPVVLKAADRLKLITSKSACYPRFGSVVEV